MRSFLEYLGKTANNGAGLQFVTLFCLLYVAVRL
jgi:hypothetical protein